MFDLTTTNTEQTMSSLDFLNNIINPAREAAGETALRNTELLRKIEDELDFNRISAKVFKPAMGRPSEYYDLTLEQMTLLGIHYYSMPIHI